MLKNFSKAYLERVLLPSLIDCSTYYYKGRSINVTSTVQITDVVWTSESGSVWTELESCAITLSDMCLGCHSTCAVTVETWFDDENVGGITYIHIVLASWMILTVTYWNRLFFPPFLCILYAMIQDTQWWWCWHQWLCNGQARVVIHGLAEASSIKVSMLGKGFLKTYPLLL